MCVAVGADGFAMGATAIAVVTSLFLNAGTRPHRPKPGKFHCVGFSGDIATHWDLGSTPGFSSLGM